MTSRDQETEKGFLSRWSQRKRAAQEPEPSSEAPEPAGAAPGEEASAANEESARPEDLPDIDSLDANSDFSVFMKKGVPETLRRRALRKLWQVDPAFKHICMLDDYNLDYTDAATVVPNLKTIYQVGKGMVLPEQEKAETDAVTTEAGEALRAPEETAEPSDEPLVAGETDAPADSGPSLSLEQEITPDTPRKRQRNPGDPLVSTAPVRRRSTPRGEARSALRRRWGETDG